MIEHDYAARLVALTASFPTLRGLLEVWDPERLDRWACGPEPGSGAICACQFLLSVYNRNAEWECGKFDFQRAYAVWDKHHRQAFLAWAQDPWWP